MADIMVVYDQFPDRQPSININQRKKKYEWNELKCNMVDYFGGDLHTIALHVGIKCQQYTNTPTHAHIRSVGWIINRLDSP